MKLLFSLFLLSQVKPSKANFSNILGEMQAAKEFHDDINTVKTAIEAASNRVNGRRTETSIANPTNSRELKKGKKAKSSFCDAKISEAEDQIDALKDEVAELTKPNYLGIQTAPTCRIERESAGKYKLIAESTAEDDAFIVFSDRPLTLEYSITTEDFVANFDEIFGQDFPNTGLTFVDESGETVGPFVVIFGSASVDGEEIIYDITQSETQSDVLSIEDIFDGSEDTVSYKDCSYFIDNWFTGFFTCDPCKAVVAALGGLAGITECDVACIAAAIPEDEIGVGEAIQAACPEICALRYGAAIGAGTALTAEVICQKSDLC